MDKLRKIIVISGMTGVGKTNIAKILSQHINGELVCVDSIQIYKGLEILSNKPSSSANQSGQHALMSDQQIQGSVNLSQAPHHLVGKYDPMNPITASQYAIQARKIIKDILSRNKTPILEGGSPFYIQQIFNPNLTNFQDPMFHKAREVARNIIQMDGNDFKKTLERAKVLFQAVKMPQEEVQKIGLNDFYRLETKMAYSLYMQAKGETYNKNVERSTFDEENQFFTNINKRCFYLFGNKKSINQVLDLRVEDMIMNDAFFPQLVDFSKQCVNQKDPELHKINPLFRSIGFLESIRYLQSFHQLEGGVNGENSMIFMDYLKRKSINTAYQHIAKSYLDDYKAKNRQFARKQNKWFRKEQDYLWMDVMMEGKIHNVINKMITYLRKDDIRKDLESDEQEKMKNVNTEDETHKELKFYKSESRILQSDELYYKFMMNSLRNANTHKGVIMNKLFVDACSDPNMVYLPKKYQSVSSKIIQNNNEILKHVQSGINFDQSKINIISSTKEKEEKRQQEQGENFNKNRKSVKQIFKKQSNQDTYLNESTNSNNQDKSSENQKKNGYQKKRNDQLSQL
eukprot:403368043